MNPPFPSVISKIHARGELSDMLFQRGAKRPFQNNAKQKVKAYTLLATRLCSSDGPTTNWKSFPLLYVDVHCFSKRSSYEVNVTENNPPGTSVLQVTVTQHRPGAILNYKIVPSNNEFRINKSTVSGTLALEVRWNKSCSRFDKALLGASSLVDAASPRTISIDKKKISSWTQGR